MKKVKKEKSVAPAEAAEAAPDVPTPARATREAKLPVTERTLQKAAKRLIDTPLVAVEISYLQRTLGNTETESTIDNAVTGVRRLPWNTIAVGS